MNQKRWPQFQAISSTSTYAYAKPALKRRSCGFGKLSHFIRSCSFNTSSKPPLSQLPTTQQSKLHMLQHDSRVLDKLVAATASYQCSNVNVTNVYCLSAIDPSGTCCIIRNSHAKLSFVMFIFKSAPLLCSWSRKCRQLKCETRHDGNKLEGN